MTEKQIEFIKSKFLSISTWEDFFNFIQFYQNNTERGSFLEKKDISYILFSKKEKYFKYQIQKKRKGEFREIDSPIQKLKATQEILKECIEYFFTPKASTHGFVLERSIVTNAKVHIKKKFVYNIDLENFFPSIHFGRILGIFKSNPFNFNPTIAKHFANICCNDNGILPQGGVTSPIISNLVCRRLDGKLSELAKKNKVMYSRYADDLTFSSNFPIFEDVKFIEEINNIIKSENFKINLKKTRLQNNKCRQVVTGLTVNKKVNVSERFLKDLRFQIWLYSEKGADAAQIRLEKDYTNRHRYDGNVPKIENVIEGKLSFLRMVWGKDSSKYKLIFDKFRKILESQIDKVAEEIKNFNNEIESLFSRLETASDNDYIDILLEIKLKINENLEKDGFNETLANKQKQFDEIIIKSSNKYLVRNLDKRNINDPFSSIDEKILDKLKIPNIGQEQNSYSPQHLAEFLELFRNGESSFKNLIHSNENTYIDVVSRAKKDFQSIGKTKKGVLQHKIPTEIHRVIGEFIRLLDTYIGYRNKSYDDKPYSLFLNSNTDKIYGFNKCYRFSEDLDNIKISDIIKYAFVDTNKNSNEIWYLYIPHDIDTIFNNVLTSTYNIYQAIKLFLQSCKKYSSIGAIRMETKKWNNKVILRLINLGVDINKDAFDYLNDTLKGDTKSIISLLNGYCHFNIRANFKNEPSKLSLIPYINEVQISENYKPIGFTYEFIFYKPLKFLLVDNGNDCKRIKQAANIISKNKDFEYLLTTTSSFNYDQDKKQLSSYNAVFIHANNPEYDAFKTYLRENRIPFISFGGEKTFEKVTINYNMSDSQFYNRLESYLIKVKETSDLSFDFWDVTTNSSNSLEFNDINKIADHIQKNKIPLSNLPTEIEQNIYKILGNKIKIPSFSNVQQLIDFIESEIITNESKNSNNLS